MSEHLTESTTAADMESAALQPPASDIIRPLEENPQEFNYWAELKESLPPWVNEIVGLSLIVFGILSFISLFIMADTLVAVTWASMLKSLFGDGAFFVAGALFAFGVLLWLPKIGLSIRLDSTRLLAIELIFLSLLAILHLSNSDSELRALARAGEGGGLVGWALSYPVLWVMGRPLALLVFGALAGISAVALLGLRRSHVSRPFSGLGARLQDYSEKFARKPEDSAEDEVQDLYNQLALSPGYRNRIMRIRTDARQVDSDDAETHSAGQAPSLERIRSAKAGAGASKSRGNGNSKVAADARPLPAAKDADAPPALETQAQAVKPPQDKWRDALPALDLLTAEEMIFPTEAEIEHKSQLIQDTLLEFDLETTVLEVQVGPTVTRFALLPHKEDGSDRIRMSKIAAYAPDLSLALAAKGLRMETPVPGTNFMGIEVPNKNPATVALRNVLESERYQEEKRRAPAALMIPLGRDVAGLPLAIDLAQMPHLLIAGTTGSGKSVCMAGIAISLLMQYSPQQLRLVMLDPKMVELTRFSGVPHLIGPVETEQERIIGVLRWCTAEMDRRYALLEEHGARDIQSYNQAQQESPMGGAPLPFMVILIDEVGDLMLSQREETERALIRLAQMARAVGMHLVIATQHPSATVITGLIKANFPARIAFAVAAGSASRVILDRGGAEDLLGRGDMLFQSPAAASPERIQGCFVSEADTRAVVQHWRGMIKDAAAPWEDDVARRAFLQETDPMLEEVLALVVASGEASTSLLQRRLNVGYPRAARIMDLLAELGVVGDELTGGKSREVIIPPGMDPLQYIMERYQAGGAAS